jgi:hypothetical protein
MALTKISTGGVKDDAASQAKIADEAVDEARLQISNAGSNGQFLSKQSGDTGGLTWATPPDTNTQVGGATGVDFNDDVKARFGTGNDLEIYHDSSESYIHDNGTGGINLKGSFVKGLNGSNEVLFNAIADQGVELYYNNSKKFWTVNNGAEITGNLKFSDTSSTDTGRLNLGNDVDLSIYHNGTLSRLDNSTGNIVIRTKVSGSFVDTLILDTSSNATFAGTVSDSKGDLRKIPLNNITSAYTAVATDSGKTIYTNSGVTINNSVFATGDAVTIVNSTGSDITITQGSGLNLYNSADASTGNRTLAGRGMATIYFAATNYAYISGAGLS